MNATRGSRTGSVIGRGPISRQPSGRRSLLDGPRGRRLVAIAVVGGVALVVGLLAGRSGSPPGQDQAQSFVTAWARGDYATMYAQIEPETQRALTPGGFAAAYRQANEIATVANLRAGRARGVHGGMVEVPVFIRTRIFGALPLSFRLPVRTTGSRTRIVWSRTLVFPGLVPGERLTRQTELAPRASLLTRDGAVLAHGQAPAGGQRPSALGAAATAITGLIGPIPAGRASELRGQGYPPNAQVGTDGLERVFESQLAGQPGGRLMAGGRILASSTTQPGTSVRTSISSRLQTEAVNALGAREGAIAVMRPANGQLLALAGIPLSGLQPPGSTFKMITLTGVLEAHLATPSSQFPFQTSTTLSGFSLSNANGENCGGSLSEAFAVSCNSVFAPLGVKLGAPRLVATARQFGFNEAPGIPGAATSTIPAPSRMADALAVGSSAIGQGEVQATALQMVIVAATIATSGRRPRPTLDAAVLTPGIPAIPASVARTVRRLMIGVVRSGTGTAAAIPGVTVAGKTGTAEVTQTAGCSDQSSSSSCGSNPMNTDAWFAAFAPALNPRVAVAVLLVRNGAGGDTAAPIARQMLVAGLAGP